MQFLTHTKIDFMKYRRPMAVISSLLVVAGLLYVFAIGKLNIGIDFAGGTQVVLDFREPQSVDTLRDVLTNAGIPEASIQRFGSAQNTEFLIRTATVEGSEEGSSERLIAALNRAYNEGTGDKIDINWAGSKDLTSALVEADPAGVGAEQAPAHYEAVAEAILDFRKENGILHSWDELAGVQGISQESRSYLEQNATLGAFSLLSVENVGPQIGGELQAKGIWAVVLSLLGMLAYIAFRFELRFGVGAVVAIAHDVAITVGIYTLMGYEFNLTTIAAFLTVVGYSVNDTVVVFDRVRENMANMRREPLRSVLNISLNQTLSRTLMTSFTTLVAVAMLFFFGGEVIRGFAFIIMIGVVVGTYSSILVASPVVLLWDRWFGKGTRVQRTVPATT